MARAGNGHESKSLNHSGSMEGFEMAHLNSRRTREQGATYGDEDNESADENEDETALLSARRTQRDSKVQNTSKIQESTWSFACGILVETAPTLLLTTVGLTFTGELLEQVGGWRALKRVDELYILIPMLNNLKGNLEMNLSSRLSTSANIGELDILSTRRALLLGNLSLLQVQALLVSAIAALLSFILGLIISPASGSSSSTLEGLSVGRRRPPFKTPPTTTEKPPSSIREFAMMLSTAMASASISGMVLGSFMCSLILGCRYFRRNPDNITPPIASCLGDLLTLCIMGLVSSILIRTIDTALPIVLLALLVFGAVTATFLTLRNEYVRQLIWSGWTPLLGAMVISAGTGLVLDHFVSRYEGFGLLAVVISGLPGAVGSVFVSRLSTSLHASSDGTYSKDHKARDPRTFTTTITLFLVSLPVQAMFLAFLYATGWLKLPLIFLAFFIIFFCCAVMASLFIARVLTNFLWRHDLDPDTYAMPIQSSLVDLVGQLMLVACFEISLALGADVLDKPNS